MATIPLTITIEESVKARLIQAAKKDGRSLSQMTNRFIELGLKEFWGGFEPVITDVRTYLDENTKEK